MKKKKTPEPPAFWPPRGQELYQAFYRNRQQRTVVARYEMFCLDAFFRYQEQQGLSFRDFPQTSVEKYLEKFRPGHMKWDYDYSIGELKPDVIVQLWGDTRPAEPYLEQDYVIGGSGDGLIFYLRKNSPNILWDRVVLSPDAAPLN